MLSFWIVIPTIAFLSNLALVGYTLHLGIRSPVNRFFVLLVASVAWWAFLSIFYPLILAPEQYDFLASLSALSWVWIGPMVLHFVLIVLRDRPLLSDHPAYVLAYAPGFVFLYLRVFTDTLYGTPVWHNWGYQGTPGPLLAAYFVYVQTFGIAGLILIARRAVRAGAGTERRRFVCMTIGAAVPLVGGTVTNLLLPLAGNSRVYFSAVGLTTIMAGFFAVGIFRYRMLRPTLMQSASQVLRTMSQPVLLIGRAGLILEANEAAQCLTEQSSDDLVGLPVPELFADGAGAWERLLAARNADGQVTNRKMQWRTTEGETVPMLVSLTPVSYRGDSHPDGYLLLGTDCRELERATEAVRDSEELYRRLYESSVLGVAIGTAERFLRVNAQVCNILGYDEAELIGRPFADFWPERQPNGRLSIEAAAGFMAAATSEEPRFTVWQWRRKDGALVDCQISLNRVSVQGKTLYQATMRDITEQRRLQQAIEHLHHVTAGAVGEAFFPVLVEHLAQALGTTWAQVGEIRPEHPERVQVLAVWHNGDLAAPYEYARSGTPCDDVLQGAFRLYPERVSERFPHDAMLVTHGIESYVGMCLRDPQGTPIGVLCAFSEHPLTSQFEQLEELFTLFAARASAEILRLRVEAHERRHMEELRELQKMESVALLAGGVAHDFNNILVGVLGQASRARELLQGHADLHRPLAVIEESAERAVGLTRQLLAYARGGKHEPEPLDLVSLVSDLMPMLGAVLPKSVRVECELDPGTPLIFADASQMQQVVMNLCTNAGEAMTETGGTLAVRLRAEDVGHAMVLLTVSDTGCGMSDDTRRRVFEPFFSTKGFGRGLGLAAVQGIVLSHGGAIDCDTQAGVGTTFRVRVPAYGPRVPVATVEHAQAPSPPGTGTILVVDDEAIVREFAEDVLTDCGYTVFTAASGDEALARYGAALDEIDVVLLDMIMPGRNGQETLEALRALREDVKVILTSGYSAEHLDTSVAGATATAFLKKPYRSHALTETIRAVLA